MQQKYIHAVCKVHALVPITKLYLKSQMNISSQYNQLTVLECRDL